MWLENVSLEKNHIFDKKRVKSNSMKIGIKWKGKKIRERNRAIFRASIKQVKRESICDSKSYMTALRNKNRLLLLRRKVNAFCA